MSEYRTHLRKSVEALRDAVERLTCVLRNDGAQDPTAGSEVLDNEARWCIDMQNASTPEALLAWGKRMTGGDASGMVEVDETAGLGKTTQADKGEAEERVAPVTVDATPAPSSPSLPRSGAGSDDVASNPPDARRWWLNMYEHGGMWVYASQETADKYANKEDASFQRVEVVPAAALDAMTRERDEAVEGLVSLRRVVANTRDPKGATRYAYVAWPQMREGR